MIYPTDEEVLLWVGRRISESKIPGNCGSCTLSIHVRQMRDPDSWVHSSKGWWMHEVREMVNKKKPAEAG